MTNLPKSALSMTPDEYAGALRRIAKDNAKNLFDKAIADSIARMEYQEQIADKKVKQASPQDARNALTMSESEWRTALSRLS